MVLRWNLILSNWFQRNSCCGETAELDKCYGRRSCQLRNLCFAIQNRHNPNTKQTQSKYETETIQIQNRHNPTNLKQTQSKYKTLPQAKCHFFHYFNFFVFITREDIMLECYNDFQTRTVRADFTIWSLSTYMLIFSAYCCWFFIILFPKYHKLKNCQLVSSGWLAFVT